MLVAPSHMFFYLANACIIAIANDVYCAVSLHMHPHANKNTQTQQKLLHNTNIHCCISYFLDKKKSTRKILSCNHHMGEYKTSFNSFALIYCDLCSTSILQHNTYATGPVLGSNGVG